MPPDDVFTETDGGHGRVGTRTTSMADFLRGAVA